MSKTPRPFFHVPPRQDFVRGPVLNIRTSQSLSSVREAVVREVHALDANLGLYEMITLQEQVKRSTSLAFVASKPDRSRACPARLILFRRVVRQGELELTMLKGVPGRQVLWQCRSGVYPAPARIHAVVGYEAF